MASSSAQLHAIFPECHSDTIECLEFIEEDRRIITGSRDGTLQVWDVGTGLLVGKPWIDTGSGAVHAMAISSNRMTVLTGSEDGRIRVWKVATGAMTKKWNPGHTATISSICWSPDELHVASGSEDGTVIIWDARRGEILGEPIRTDHQHVYAVRYLSDGTTLVTSGYNNVVISWDVRKREVPLRILEACPASQQVRCIALSSDCKRLFLGCSDRIVQTGTSAQETDIICLGERTGPISATILSHDDSWLATTSLDSTHRTLCLWDLQPNQPIAQHLKHDNGLKCAAFARNGRLLATGGVDRKVYLWDISALRGRNPSNYADHEAASMQSHSDPDATTRPGAQLVNDPLSSDATNRTTRRRPTVDVPSRLPPGFFDDSPRHPNRSPLRHTPRNEPARWPILQVVVAHAQQVFNVRRPQISLTRPQGLDRELGPLDDSPTVTSSPQERRATLESIAIGEAHRTDEASNHEPRRRVVKDGLWLRLFMRFGCVTSVNMES